MRKWLSVPGGGVVIVALAALAGVVAFDAPVKPPPLPASDNPYAAVDFSDLPALRTYAARDGAKLGYRLYQGRLHEGGTSVTVVLVHGAWDDGTGMHLLAKALRDTGASVYVPVLRGHDHAGRPGDIDYIGQLEDDLADLVSTIRPLRPHSTFCLIGFSLGGGFVLRVLASPDEKLFDRFIMISPPLPPGAPTNRPGATITLTGPRAAVLTALTRLGIDWFDGLPVVTFAGIENVPFLTTSYSFRLATDFAPPPDYVDALRRSTKPAALLIGGDDELFYADRYAPLLRPVRPDLRISMVPGVHHLGMVLTPAGIAAVRKAFLDHTADGPPKTP